MKFRDDIDPANTWIVSDTHFGHENIVGYSHRPEDHDQVIIAEWRKEVPEDATVLHLGDLSYKSNAWFRAIVAKELIGARKLLIQGNHDKQRYSFYRNAGFQIVRPFAIMVTESRDEGVKVFERPQDFKDPMFEYGAWRVSFSHYPWDDEQEGEWMQDRDLRVHGHIHNSGYTRAAYVPFLKQHVNLSVEQTAYKPVNLKLLLDAVLLGQFPATTDESRAEAAARKELAKAAGES